MRYFNTFGGNTVAMAAARSTLEVIQREGLQENARRVGALVRSGLESIAKEVPCFGDVRGAGLYDMATLTLEPTVRHAVVAGLAAKGHRPHVLTPDNLDFGSAQLVQMLPSEHGVIAYIAGSDHRRDGQAIVC